MKKQGRSGLRIIMLPCTLCLTIRIILILFMFSICRRGGGEIRPQGGRLGVRYGKAARDDRGTGGRADGENDEHQGNKEGQDDPQHFSSPSHGCQCLLLGLLRIKTTKYMSPCVFCFIPCNRFSLEMILCVIFCSHSLFQELFIWIHRNFVLNNPALNVII